MFCQQVNDMIGIRVFGVVLTARGNFAGCISANFVRHTFDQNLD
jgi:hypothetical protein